ncbi:MAG TPA: arginyltransferase [Rectinemataceae bacterium]|nr:arginyltransferase [Rectinemataceae bacterium]
MRVIVREMEYGPCPYLEGRVWRVEEFSAPEFDPAVYESLLASGWRRSGHSFYRSLCPGCESCTPLRLDVRSFEPSRSQRRLLRLNADLALELLPPTFSEERYDLYRRYLRFQHGERGEPSDEARASYSSFLLAGPFDTTAVAEYRDSGGRLLATGYVDILPDGLSSVYFAFDPEAARRSLGTWSVLRETRLAAELGKRYYYLGFWVPGAAKMDYKANFTPFETASRGRWTLRGGRDEALAELPAPDISAGGRP